MLKKFIFICLTLFVICSCINKTSNSSYKSSILTDKESEFNTETENINSTSIFTSVKETYSSSSEDEEELTSSPKLETSSELSITITSEEETISWFPKV